MSGPLINKVNFFITNESSLILNIKDPNLLKRIANHKSCTDRIRLELLKNTSNKDPLLLKKILNDITCNTDDTIIELGRLKLKHDDRFKKVLPNPNESLSEVLSSTLLRLYKSQKTEDPTTLLDKPFIRV